MKFEKVGSLRTDFFYEIGQKFPIWILTILRKLCIIKGVFNTETI